MPHCLLLLLLLQALHQSADSCMVNQARQLHTRIIEGKLAAVRCSDLVNNGKSLTDPSNFIECVPRSKEKACINGVRCIGYRCTCADGMVYVPGVGCTDVNECEVEEIQSCIGASGSVTCINAQGSFMCNCTQPQQHYSPISGCSHTPECVFPFKFQGQSYNGCTSTGRGRLWCGQTDDVDRDNRWIECPVKYASRHCAMQYTRNGQRVSGCFIDEPTGRRMCSLTDDFDQDKMADLCMLFD